MIPTEPIGSIPRPQSLIEASAAFARGECSPARLAEVEEEALRDTVARFEATGSPVVSDGEQTKSSFATYPLEGLDNLGAEGVVIPFADGHTRQLPVLTAGPFRYSHYADQYLRRCRELTSRPVKQAVIAVSALSLLYPEAGIDGYSKEAFLADLVDEGVTDIRRCLDAGAHRVQMDFTEGRLALGLDPSGGLLESFVSLDREVLSRFDEAERQRIGVHSCPGADQDAAHSAGVDYAGLLPRLLSLAAGSFSLQMASETDRPRVLGIVREHLGADVRVFIGVTDPINGRVETAEEVRDQILDAAELIPVQQLGTTDDCGFSPFGDDTTRSRDFAFDKIAARARGTALASEILGV